MALGSLPRGVGTICWHFLSCLNIETNTYNDFYGCIDVELSKQLIYLWHTDIECVITCFPHEILIAHFANHTFLYEIFILYFLNIVFPYERLILGLPHVAVPHAKLISQFANHSFPKEISMLHFLLFDSVSILISTRD